MDIIVSNIKLCEDDDYFTTEASVSINGIIKDFYEFYDPVLKSIDKSCDSSISVHPETFDLSEFETEDISEHEVLDAVISKIENSDEFKSQSDVFYNDLIADYKINVDFYIKENLKRLNDSFIICYIILEDTKLIHPSIIQKVVKNDLNGEFDNNELLERGFLIGEEDYLRDEQNDLSYSFSERFDLIVQKAESNGLKVDSDGSKYLLINEQGETIAQLKNFSSLELMLDKL